MTGQQITHPGSNASRALPRRPRSIGILGVCVITALFDGMDIQALSFVAPKLTREWDVPLPAFGVAFTSGIAGLILGGLFIAPLGDRVGRKALIVAATVGIALTTLLTAMCTNVSQLAAIRFLTGIGLGTIMPVLVATVHECAPPHRRALYVTILMCGFPTGGFLGGVIAAWGLPRHGWEALFLGMGLFALGIAAILAAILSGGRPVRRPDAQPPSGLSLLRDGRTLPTILIWVLFFATLLNIYLLASWLPSLLVRAGLTDPEAALAAGINSLGGAVGGILLGFLIGRVGSRVLILAYLVGAPAIAMLGFAGGSWPAVIAVSFLIGVLIPGGHACNSAIVAAQYPSELRATGIGWAQSVGRLGSVLGPGLVAVAIQDEWTNQAIFGAASVFALVSAGAVAALTFTTGRAAPDNKS